ncbi:ring-1,2-phenylacetyl-CoA epoxidase subunit PaaC [Halopolyspora algeriensis]|uniref:Ring-1,2-phenylacetyl-CoA epoxidase subunit PaaC n=1 Tax=Halopolyspora algeriensis TaxID=1500506 RepID=A0A368W2T0_9ACTN|nr:1,2-phenylacetyl-CoA epoxidase subunit PaaC [Halopolyspora algeriensis]RCW46993.1 ring-1,2-phenylacetyl-CoA epoxidase subunit PaaC [Halopolyspora algeriensis]TQM48082.1 ring-1,2-phenylacetyl-CoA epoxidase subunit PaaC [Halopolyspora algeriensis]
MSFDNAYEALVADHAEGDARWAFGTGFDDPLAGVDTAVPSGVDGDDLAAYCLMLGDDALILSHRLTEWCTRAHELEDEVALANIALDLLGQARMLLARAGQTDGTGRSEDELAYFRDENRFRNVRLAELPGGDFGRTIAQLLVFSTWKLAEFSRLSRSRDPVLAAIAAKGVKELTYHRDYAARWAVRLGDGTDHSHERMQRGLDEVWPLVAELFTAHAVQRRVVDAGVGVDPAELRDEFDDVLGQVLEPAGLRRPEVAPMGRVADRAGRDGVHTEHLGYLLAEMQSLARAHPEATW